MKAVDILEWTMGWAWPVMAGLVALMAWGITRVMTWDKQDLPGEQGFSSIRGGQCVCQCSE